jgi:hypothetical protein
MDEDGAQCGEIPGLEDIILKLAITISGKFTYFHGRTALLGLNGHSMH